MSFPLCLIALACNITFEYCITKLFWRRKTSALEPGLEVPSQDFLERDFYLYCLVFCGLRPSTLQRDIFVNKKIAKYWKYEEIKHNKIYSSVLLPWLQSTVWVEGILSSLYSHSAQHSVTPGLHISSEPHRFITASLQHCQLPRTWRFF